MVVLALQQVRVWVEEGKGSSGSWSSGKGGGSAMCRRKGGKEMLLLLDSFYRVWWQHCSCVGSYGLGCCCI